MNQKSIDDVVSTYITQKEASDFLNCSERSLLRYRNKGILPFTKVKAKICFKIEDVAKLHITMQNSTINAKILQRLEFAELEIKSLKNRISLLESINGFILDEIKSMSEQEILETRECFKSILSASSMKWNDIEKWSRDLIRISIDLLKQIGEDLSRLCIEKLLSLLSFYKRKSSKSLQLKLRARLYSF